jgi:hypothetical protein
METLEAVILFGPRGSYKRRWILEFKSNPCGGEVEYLDRDPASRGRRQKKGSLKSEAVKYGH